MSRNIIIVTGVYPSWKDPGSGAFVRNVRDDFITKGYGVKVLHIVPLHVLFLKRKIFVEFLSELFQVQKDRIYVPYLSLSHRTFCGIDLMRYTHAMLKLSLYISSRLFKLHSFCDVAYGKFLNEGGIGASYLARFLSVPYCLDLGESYSLLRFENSTELKLVIVQASVIYCVSERLCTEVVKLGGIQKRIVLAPNNADDMKFFPRNRDDCRKILEINVPEDKQVVCFVGHFIERKGPNRVLAALEFGDEFVGVFLGKGPIEIDGEKVLFVGQVNHELLPLWLNAADIFVLPTLGEGWCNAIEEAYSCGLPLVVSDIEDVKKQLGTRQASFCDPNDEYSIYNSLLEAKNFKSVVDLKYSKNRGDIIASKIPK